MQQSNMIFIDRTTVVSSEEVSRRWQTKLNLINDKFIVAQNVQNNKQMDSPHPPPSNLPVTFFSSMKSKSWNLRLRQVQ